MQMLDLPQVVSTVLGGAISLATALVMFWLANRKERIERHREETKQRANLAYVGLLKLIKAANVIENIARHIDAELRQASERGLQTNEIASLVRPSIGGRIDIEDASPSELAFLVPLNHDLAAKIWEIQQRARSHQVVLDAYNYERREFDEWILREAETASDVSATGASFELAPAMKTRADLKLGKLNQVLAGLILGLEEDRAEVKKIVKQYIQEAKSTFGGDFPVKHVDWKGPTR